MIYCSLLKKLFKRISHPNPLSWERYISVLLVLYIIVAGIFFIKNPSISIIKIPFIWPVIIILLTACFIFLLKIYKIYIKKELGVNKSQEGISSLLFLSGFAMLISFLGYYWELFQLKQYGHILETKLIYLIQTSDNVFSMTLKEIALWMSESSIFVMIGMMTTMIIAFMWYFLVNKVEYKDRSADHSTVTD